MNAGFSNLATLKAHLQNSGLRARTDFDTAITALGLGVAAQFERHCTRLFTRAASTTMKFPADQDHVIVERYPIEAVTKVEVQNNPTAGFVESAGAIQNWNADSGIVWFGSALGMSNEVAKLTYTGGYFWETKETTDQGYPTSVPSGSTALPDDLKLAWLLQCGAVWAAMDKLGIGVADKPEAQSKTAASKLIPQVEDILKTYRRFSIL
jgi:hypothetical protein